MSPRRPLTEGVNKLDHTDPDAVRKFVTQTPSSDATENAESESQPTVVRRVDSTPNEEAQLPNLSKKGEPTKPIRVGLVPVTVRLTPEIASALKRISLERQLAGVEVFTQQDIVEEALVPWLKKEGVL